MDNNSLKFTRFFISNFRKKRETVQITMAQPSKFKHKKIRVELGRIMDTISVPQVNGQSMGLNCEIFVR